MRRRAAPNGACPLLVALLLLAPAALPRPAWADAAEHQYRESAAAFHRLQSQPQPAAAPWNALAEEFLRIQKTAPAHARGPDALFSAGLCRREAFRQGGESEDLRAAVEHFQSFVREYPRHPLADDALMHIGEIFADSFGDPHVAYLEYRKVVELYPEGDQAALADKRARLLSPRLGRSSGKADEKIGTEARPIAFQKAVAPSAAEAPTPQEGAGESKATLKRVQFLSTPEWTRVILTLSGPVAYRQGELAPGPNRPRRLYLDLPSVEPGPEITGPLVVDDAALRRIRVGSLASATTRVVFDLATLQDFTIKTFALPLEWKLVLDLHPGKAEAQRQREERLTADRRARTPANTLPSLNQTLGLKVKSIVLDPGHGGHDPGAIAEGMQEKDITLKIARRLREVFRRRRPDLTVRLTREDDRFIALAQRPKIAKALGGDLFVSVHINASEVERLQGVETYFLNLTTDASSIQVAARENASTEKQVGDLNAILFDLLRDANIIESSKLANTVQSALVERLRGKRQVRDLGVKQAPFMVLVGAEMPSVLVEAGFITNEAERKRMADGEYLQQIAEGIYEGLQAYIEHQTVAGGGAEAPVALTQAR